MRYGNCVVNALRRTQHREDGAVGKRLRGVSQETHGRGLFEAVEVEWRVRAGGTGEDI
jgi:hypothetical protein